MDWIIIGMLLVGVVGLAFNYARWAVTNAHQIGVLSMRALCFWLVVWGFVGFVAMVVRF